MNRVLIAGRLTRDPEMRKLASGKTVTTFSVATNDYRAGSEKAEYHSVVTWVPSPVGRMRRARSPKKSRPAERSARDEPRCGPPTCLPHYTG
jgi:hypothetical protein